jgi:GNAT superfamily N-acetyltransferase
MSDPNAIEPVFNPDGKSLICRSVLESLPAWFGVAESIGGYCESVRSHPVWAAFDGGEAIAFLSLLEHNPHSAEIEVMGIRPEFHRKGIGRRLVAAAERYCAGRGKTFLLVKTLDFASDYEPYARTREFYLAMGFLPLQVLDGYWNEENPCLLMCKSVKAGAAVMP